MKKQFLKYEADQHHLKLLCLGKWTLASVRQIEKELENVPCDKKIICDLSSVEDFDSAGVLLFIEYFNRFQNETTVKIVGYSKSQKEMYNLLNKNIHAFETPKKKSFLEIIGENTIEILSDIKDFVTFSGHLFYALFHTWRKPKDIRIKETVYHIHQSGFNALIIIALTSFLVGMVISYQGSVQLAKFGADMFIVDTVAISITRELGPMITAIVIAGRSGSAYTAEIGAMKITEEIDAMRTMGFDPFLFIVLPNILALMIALPMIIFLADIMGIIGGMLAARMELSITPVEFINRIEEIFNIDHLYVGLIKGPFFALIIASIGSMRGMAVENSTDSIGINTKASVVSAIFMVIICDAIFSIIFLELGI